MLMRHIHALLVATAALGLTASCSGSDSPTDNGAEGANASTGGGATGGKGTGGAATADASTGDASTDGAPGDSGAGTVNCSAAPLSGGSAHCSSNASGSVNDLTWTIWSSGGGGC